MMPQNNGWCRPLHADATGQAASLRFLVVSDTQRPMPGRRPNHAPRRAIYRQLAEALRNAVPVFHVGDMVDQGGRASSWLRSFDALFWNDLRPEERRYFYPVPGNHEFKRHWLDPGEGDLRHFHARFPHLHGSTFYGLTHGSSAFVCMDSGSNSLVKLLRGERWQNAGGEQLRWVQRAVLPELQEQVAAGRIRTLFLFFHKPAYATAGCRKNADSAAMLDRFATLRTAAPDTLTIVAVNGHIHSFAHIRPRKYIMQDAPLEQVIVGTGGGTQRGSRYFGAIRSPDGLDMYRRLKYDEITDTPGTNYEAVSRLCRDAGHFGYLDVTVEERLTIRYMRYVVDDDAFTLDYEFVR